MSGIDDLTTALTEQPIDRLAKALLPDGDSGSDDLSFAPLEKSTGEWRFVQGPLYLANTLDAHQEYADEDALRKAVHEYMRAGDFRLRQQHDRDRVIGEVVELMVVPAPLTAPLTVGGVTKSTTFPKGTAFMGAVFTPEAWPLVTRGEIRGFSMGGRAVRVPER